MSKAYSREYRGDGKGILPIFTGDNRIQGGLFKVKEVVEAAYSENFGITNASEGTYV
ncbi:hypothetical protein LEP1GSC050_3655 [Leptospira broomii serovar Hurstbridge str. 5399]|uniref:Uncharacterized protein n=1 Tax=Leptospira broomii serovar Hurstbridge str. 5399 TaxID=1049789 RepID=T0FA83_9LEPT|nr:hypothetical protein [Leptospira broomii]EQA44806.1 hypothetical protein LEP1GSC050_3655 [Leptospira broomii serovar Hurstbridge str. 5399]